MLTSIIVPTVLNPEAVARVTTAIEANTGPGYELIVVDTSPIPMGYVRTANQGLDQASGDVFVVMNDDAIPRPGWLEPLLDAVGRGVWLCSPGWAHALIAGHCLCFPRECRAATGAFDERYIHTCADQHLELQVYDLGHTVCQVPESNVIHNANDLLRIHHRKSMRAGNHGLLPETGAWYNRDQAVYEAFWGDRRTSDHWPEEWN